MQKCCVETLLFWMISFQTHSYYKHINHIQSVKTWFDFDYLLILYIGDLFAMYENFRNSLESNQ